MTTSERSEQAPFTRRILVVDDDPVQLKLLRVRLVDAGFDVETAGGAREALSKAARTLPDAIVSDVIMGEVDGFALCYQIRAMPALARIPVILLSAHFRTDEDQQLALRVGASALVTRTGDFGAELAMIRDQLDERHTQPVASVDGSLMEEHLRTSANQLARLAGEARRVEERFRTLFDNASDTITFLTPDGVILDANERWRDIIGIGPREMIGRNIREFADPDAAGSNYATFQTAQGTGRSDVVPIQCQDGRTVFMEFSVTVLETGQEPLVASIGRDVTEAVLAARSVAAAEERYRSLVERIPDAIWTARADGALTFITPNVSTILGISAEEFCAEDLDTRTQQVHPDDRVILRDAFRGFADQGTTFDMEYRRRRKDGRWVWIRNRSIARYEREGVVYIEGMLSDVTERKNLEESFRQSQKMEAIGQLTGGIAHDFNNILAAIIANSHFLIDDLSEGDPRRADAEEIKSAAEKAAALTRQLLAFSRRQVLELKTVDLNKAIGGIEKMVGRLIGEDIELSVRPCEESCTVRVDVGQLEQVILNLVVNARDAMPSGGRLVIETSNVDVGEGEQVISDVSVAPGRYVLLAVSDTGQGMDSETKRHIFEPFFTTKAIGKGTGLGLSTCYGIVKQSGGHIGVYSELGHGTVFRIYLPRVDADGVSARPRAIVEDTTGTETILVVEDDDGVRSAVARMLEGRGYTVLLSRNGPDACEVARRHSGQIHLVVSDVIMPGGSGPEVVAGLRQICGPVRALFMSGYTDHAVVNHGVLEGGLSFIQKPFSPVTFARKLRELLDAGE